MDGKKNADEKFITHDGYTIMEYRFNTWRNGTSIRKGRDDILHGKDTYDRTLAETNKIVLACGDWMSCMV